MTGDTGRATSDGLDRDSVHSVIIVGPGAMGLLFAARMRRAGFDVRLLDYSADRAARLNRSGILLIDDGHTCGPTFVPVFASPDAMAQCPSADLVLFCVKAYATERAIDHAAPLMMPDTAVATLQNGIGNAERIAERFGRDRTLVGTTAEGATLLEVGRVRHAGRGTTRIGSMLPAKHDAAAQMCAALIDAGFLAETTKDWESAVWAKAVVSAAINPVAALLGVPNGYIADSPGLQAIVRQIAREGTMIARSRGLQVPSDLPARAVDVCRATAANRASMLQDVDHGRQTELEQINDVLLQVAAARNQDAPVLRMATELARARATLSAPEYASKRPSENASESS